MRVAKDNSSGMAERVKDREGLERMRVRERERERERERVRVRERA